ncbi:hypothetical protein ACC771_09920 [Rhizobium ruizarguesonis]
MAHPKQYETEAGAVRRVGDVSTAAAADIQSVQAGVSNASPNFN